MEAAHGILSLCCGLPLALARTGDHVSQLSNSGPGFEYACRQYMKERKTEANPDHLDPPKKEIVEFLDPVIGLSLNHLKSELKILAGLFGLSPTYSREETYYSFCVLPKQSRIPVPVLSRMWNQKDNTSAVRILRLFWTMSMGRFGMDEDEFIVHDLVQDFCRYKVQENGAKKWHIRLLQGYMPSLSNTTSNISHIDFGVGRNDFLNYPPQMWTSA